MEKCFFFERPYGNPENQYVNDLLRWREKVSLATKSVGCAEMQKRYKIGCFAYFGETDE